MRATNIIIQGEAGAGAALSFKISLMDASWSGVRGADVE